MEMDFTVSDDVDLNSFYPPAIQNAQDEGDLPPAADGSNAGVGVEKPYHSKRPHKKSRAGCTNCKKRKVKCNEERPACQACILRKETCVYPSTSGKKAPSSSSSKSPSSLSSDFTTSASQAQTSASPSQASFASVLDNDPFQTVLSEPLYRPAQMADAIDMRMLWFWTAQTYGSFSIESGRSPLIDQVLKFKVVEHAFRSPFLMDCVMALSALQMQSLNQDVSPQRALAYRANAFAGYRAAIEAANPRDFPALLATSLLMAALSSQVFREDEHKPLYIIDWMQVWKGIGLIVEIITPESIQESGLAAIFYRPPVNIEKSSRHIPNNLLFMVTSITAGDDDYEHQQVYYETLQYLGSLYMELNHGFGPMLDLRTITWFTFIPKDFVPLAKMYHPRALIILAYYLCFTKLNRPVWWMQGLADPEIDHICSVMGNDWEHLLRIPRKVRQTDDKLEIAKIITENHNWSPEEEDLYQRHLNGTAKYHLVSTLPVQRPEPLYPEDQGRGGGEVGARPSVNEHTDVIASGTLFDKLAQVDPSFSMESPPRVTVVCDVTDSSSSGLSSASPRFVSASPAPQSMASSSSPGSSTSGSTESPQPQSREDRNWMVIYELQRQVFVGDPLTDVQGRLI